MEPLNDNDMADCSGGFWDEDCQFDTFEDSSLATKPQCSRVYQQFPDYDFKAAAYEREQMEASGLPADLFLRREDMKIKDVVKKRALPFLPAKSLKKLRAVSREWNQWIGSPLLAFQQSFSFQKLSGYFYQKMNSQFGPEFLPLDRSTNGVPSPSLGYLSEAVKVLSSSGGLLLCQGQEDYYVCNPATKDWKKLPRPQYYHGSEPAAVLAFDPLCNIESFYHVITAVPILGHPVVGFEIYSSESNSWRRSSSDCFELENSSLAGGGLYMKGVAYWNTSSTEMLAFELKNEIPAVLQIQSGRHGTLTLIGDEVCYVTAYNHSGNVFVIDIYGGMDMNLKHSVSTNLGPEMPYYPQACETLPCTDSDTVVIHTKAKIYCYRLKDKKVQTMKSPGPLAPNTRFHPYINSLTMLHDLVKPRH